MRRLLDQPPHQAASRHQDRPAALAIAVTVLWLLGLVVVTLITHATSHATPAPATSPGIVIVPTPTPAPDTTIPAPAGGDVDPAATYIPIPAGPPTSEALSEHTSEHAGMIPLAAVKQPPIPGPWSHWPRWQAFLFELAVVLGGVAAITAVLT